jgi:hypothetical protein
VRAKAAQLLLHARVRRPQLVAAVLHSLTHNDDSMSTAPGYACACSQTDNTELTTFVHSYARHLVRTDTMFADFARTLQRRRQYMYNWHTAAGGGVSSTSGASLIRACVWSECVHRGCYAEDALASAISVDSADGSFRSCRAYITPTNGQSLVDVSCGHIYQTAFADDG